MKPDKDYFRKRRSAAGKGHATRPVDKKRFDENFDQIDWSNGEDEGEKEPPKEE